MAIARVDEENIPQRKSYGEMIVAAIGAINDDAGSTEDVISKYISSTYEGLPPNHPDFVSVNLNMLIHKGLIDARPAYFIKHPNESFSDNLSPKIVEGIKSLEEEGGSTECSITEYIRGRFGPVSSSSHLKVQLEMLVKNGVIGINNVYFLLGQGRIWLNAIQVPFYNDLSLYMWRRRCSTTNVEGNIIGTVSTHRGKSEAKKAKRKEKSIARLMQETKPGTWEMEEWNPENSCVTGGITGTVLSAHTAKY